jgi:uncharacterized cupredoxin-like copper-binding protein
MFTMSGQRTFSRVRAAVPPVVLLAALAACGGTATPVSSPATGLSSPVTGPGGTSSSPAPGSPAGGPSQAEPAADVTVGITLAGGKVSPNGASVRVKAGQTVRINATADTADKLHVHGYDRELEVVPGRTASLTLTADRKGVFEIETHESGKLVVKLLVS